MKGAKNMKRNEIKRLCRFKGANGSMGLKHDDLHLLNIEDDGVIKVRSIIYVKDGVHERKWNFYCVYSNWHKFLENWDIIG